eukprot:c38907_g1_i1.p1 GENE.c38907_g1_i1~~c38907_g1_i1.p1  ORF type:complete len:558 (-),score=99.18 c38907_g1_i1:90-1763(-)
MGDHSPACPHEMDSLRGIAKQAMDKAQKTVDSARRTIAAQYDQTGASGQPIPDSAEQGATNPSRDPPAREQPVRQRPPTDEPRVESLRISESQHEAPAREAPRPVPQKPVPVETDLLGFSEAPSNSRSASASPVQMEISAPPTTNLLDMGDQWGELTSAPAPAQQNLLFVDEPAALKPPSSTASTGFQSANTVESFFDAPQDPTSSNHPNHAPTRAEDAFSDWIGGGETKDTNQAKQHPPANKQQQAPSAPARSKPNQNQTQGAASLLHDEPAPSSVVSHQGGANDDSIVIALNEIQIERKIGAGSYGDVLLGLWRATPVAIKHVPPEKINNKSMADFTQEVTILRKMRHPNIMMFMGANMTPPEVFVVTEFCPMGNLFQLLHESNEAISMQRKVCFALDIARGLAYLHGFQPAIVHRDIKTLNILLDRSYNCKICDFGLARPANQVLTEKVGTYQFMAPEMFSGKQRYNEKVDVYAFGIMLWEIVVGKLPYASMLGTQVPLCVQNGTRPPIPDDCPQFLSTLMAQCWDTNPLNRPPMAYVATQLSQAADRLTNMFL